MGKGTLRKKLAKGKNKATMPISIRLSVQTIEKLAQIEEATDLNFAWLLSMLADRLVQTWEPQKTIKLPLYIAMMCEDEARERGLLKEESPPATGKRKKVS